ncbi:MAG: hypothetical protein JST93_12675 [Acidobacteria bacterium]|nr:hypothetical protein [Acidobacteriota bacterium]
MGDVLHDAVKEALERALRSPSFSQSERQRNLLRYLVESTLNGKVPKETVVGVEVYGRGADFDPKQDSIVRVEASRLRQRLAAYYMAEGRDEKVRIELPRGSYRCEFITPPAPQGLPRPEPPRRRNLLFSVAGLALLVALLGYGLSNRKAPERPEEVAAYLEAHRLLHVPVDEGAPGRVRQAVGLLEHAARQDYASPRIHSALAEAYLSLADYEPARTAERNSLAEAEARKAIAGDDTLDDAHHTLGAALFFGKWELQGALSEFNRAVTLNPRRAPTQRLRADVLCILGRFGEAVDALEKAQLLQPEQVEIGAERALVFYHWRRYDQALAEAGRVLSMQPGFVPARWFRAIALQQQGRKAEAEQELRSLPERPRRYRIAMVHLLASTGREAEAQALAAQVEAAEPYPYLHVILEAGRGNRAETLRLLKEAAARRDINVLYARLDPRLDLVRDSPEFQALLKGLGL